jgi:hypothetical protein
MEAVIQQILSFIFTDPTQGGMLAILLLACAGLIWWLIRKDKEYKTDMKELIDQFQKQHDDNRKDLTEIIEKYQEGQISVIQAINEIKILLATIGAKL